MLGILHFLRHVHLTYKKFKNLTLEWSSGDNTELYLYKQTSVQKSVNLKHSSVLTGMFRFKTVSHFVSQHCELGTEHGGSHFEIFFFINSVKY